MHNQLFIVVLVIYSTLLSRSIPYYPTTHYFQICENPLLHDGFWFLCVILGGKDDTPTILKSA